MQIKWKRKIDSYIQKRLSVKGEAVFLSWRKETEYGKL